RSGAGELCPRVPCPAERRFVMARYDRIAALPLPPRSQTIPGWCVMRELSGRERDTELANRMRLFFLALRPVRRLVDRGFEVSFDSHDRQIAAVRAVLDTMPASALEQVRLRAFLNAVSTRLPERVALATLDVATMAESRSYYEAATEFAHTALAAAAHRAQSVATARVPDRSEHTSPRAGRAREPRCRDDGGVALLLRGRDRVRAHSACRRRAREPRRRGTGVHVACPARTQERPLE